MIEIGVLPLHDGQYRVVIDFVEGDTFMTRETFVSFPRSKEDADAFALKVKTMISTQVARIKAPHG